MRLAIGIGLFGVGLYTLWLTIRPRQDDEPCIGIDDPEWQERHPNERQFLQSPSFPTPKPGGVLELDTDGKQMAESDLWYEWEPGRYGF